MFWYVAASLVAVGLLLFVAVKWAERSTAKEKAKYQLPVEGERLLGLGALMLTVNDRATYILKLSDLDKETKQIAEWWGVTSPKAAKETIQWLLTGGARRTYDAGFNAMQGGTCLSKIKRVSAEGFLRAKEMKTQWVAAGLMPEALKVSSLAAFDIERAVWLARVSHNLGYLQDAEFWRVMTVATRLATHRFSSWSEYGASFVLGQAVLEECKADYLKAVCQLLLEDEVMIDQPRIWQLHCWESLDHQSAFLAAFDHGTSLSERSESVPASAAALGFGAILMWYFDAYALRLRCDQNTDGDRRWLADAYGICDAETAEKSLQDLISQGVHEELDVVLAADAHGLTGLKREDAAAYLRAMDVVAEIKKSGIAMQASKGWSSVLAYDLERAAYISRIVLALGYADEPATLRRLGRIAVQAHRQFESWEDYLASFLLGAAICSDSSTSALEMLSVGNNLLQFQSPFENYHSPWQVHPFRKSGTLHAVQ